MGKDKLMQTYCRFDINFEKGKGSKVYDTEGKEYIDFVAGVAVNCLGHSHPALVNAIKEQSEKLIHISNLYWNPNQMELAKKLCEHSDHSQVFLSNSGAEAVETALKLAKKYGKIKGGDKKNKVLYMSDSFHGRTIGALSVTGSSDNKYQKDFMPLMPGTQVVKFNDMKDLEDKFDEHVCALIVEPVQGEGGVIEADTEFLSLSRSLCDKYDAALIFDEVQCGMGRMGTLFAYKSFGIVPDVICLAKGLGGGFPIGATIGNERISSAFTFGDHGCTFGGNPLASAAALAVLKELVENGVAEGVNEKSAYMFEKLNGLCEKYGSIETIKGKGLLIGIQFNCDTSEFVSKSLESGLLLAKAQGNVVRVMPALTVEKEVIDQAVEIMDNVLEAIEA
ncbi:acetylornithine aminotransferase apoenzyme [Peptoclostridium litorale DSM 5388]|uniref:Acetylornithine aminotransferase n=1 Tax=Peptoclostridium litorale DSM 5388 TaxID=1121324 RepID=A0A069RAQ8_PEPLI|nr:aspartate aminotransferase family protein [Peptoclostridium litorale]KDR94124.1 acetylornithine aminotransferase ArgD [Peptoclostridium litorale DSM 5388]SIN81172.1 acetylornithine aminotransferase apoenzyme [Peptoclostridium litorale DSM 5388]